MSLVEVLLAEGREGEAKEVLDGVCRGRFPGLGLKRRVRWWLVRGRVEEAVADAERLLEEWPDPEAEALLARARASGTRRARLQAQLGERVERLEALAAELAAEGRHLEARQRFEERVMAQPWRADLWVEYSRYQSEQGDVVGAWGSAVHASRLAPGDPGAAQREAEAWLELGVEAAAMQRLRHVLELEPGNVEARILWWELRTRRLGRGAGNLLETLQQELRELDLTPEQSAAFGQVFERIRRASEGR